MILPVITMLLLISILIIAHEFGHFYVAKRCGVRVERFGFGLPIGPVLWSKKVGETEYCLHPLLFGGYVAFPDDSPDSTVPLDSKERFENQSLGNRAAIALAGITVNAILGWLLMTAVLQVWGIPSMEVTIARPIPSVQTLKLSAETPAFQQWAALPFAEKQVPQVWLGDRLITGYEPFLLLMEKFSRSTGSQFQEIRFINAPLSQHVSKTLPSYLEGIALVGSPAMKGNIESDTVIKAINNEPVKGVFTEPLQWVSETIHASADKPIVLTLENAVGIHEEVSITPNAKGMIGVQLGGRSKNMPVHNILTAASESTRILSSLVVKNFQAMGAMLSGNIDPSQLAGPIKIVDTGAKLIQSDGIQQGLVLTAIISVILAVMNVLPIPPLDGSHLLFLGIEAIKGRPLEKTIQERIIQVGFLGLMSLMVFVIWNDVQNTWIHPLP